MLRGRREWGQMAQGGRGVSQVDTGASQALSAHTLCPCWQQPGYTWPHGDMVAREGSVAGQLCCCDRLPQKAPTCG